MKYVSTRGAAPVLGFEDVLLSGLACDGGLYVPETWPFFSAAEISGWRSLAYPELAAKVMQPFVGDAFAPAELEALFRDAYGAFGHAATAPLKQLGEGVWLQELFHGPTLAFKDYALQAVGRMFDHVLRKRGVRRTIVGATSGDTGSAAIEACRDREALEVFILFPEGRVSEVQRRQMTTVPARNVHCIALNGTFDDCQDIVKALFDRAAFRDECGASAVNSINWARIAVQTVYYFWAALALGAPDRPVAFSAPTGNFGNVFAGYVARKMGLPISSFVVGSNRNDVLTRFFDTGTMRTAPVTPSLSPSMDIQISSNVERLLFEFYGRDGGAVGRWMRRFRQTGEHRLPDDVFKPMQALFAGARIDDDETKATMRDVYLRTGELLDPHSAVGVAAFGKARMRLADPSSPMAGPMVCLATAHPAKFPDAVREASGVHPALPSRLEDLYRRAERCIGLPNDVETVERYIRRTAAGRGDDSL